RRFSFLFSTLVLKKLITPANSSSLIVMNLSKWALRISDILLRRFELIQRYGSRYRIVAKSGVYYSNFLTESGKVFLHPCHQIPIVLWNNSMATAIFM